MVLELMLVLLLGFCWSWVWKQRWWAPVLGLKTVKFGGGMFRIGEVLGDFKILGLGEDGFERESPGAGEDFFSLAQAFF